ncbi:MAG: hypothetical protein ACOX43_09045 [Bacilli bacterium]|jgi:drug/metabolite transporter (DMT)-like permease
MKYKYAKRIATFSIVFGALSFFGNFGSGPSDLGGLTFILVFILTVALIVSGSIVNSRLKKENFNIDIFVYILIGIYSLMTLSGFIALFIEEFMAFLIMIAFVAFPMYSGIKYLTYKNMSDEHE